MNKLLQAFIQIKKQKSHRRKSKLKDPEVPPPQTQRETKTDRYADDNKPDPISAKKMNPITTVKRTKPLINSNIVSSVKRQNGRSSLKQEPNKETHSSGSDYEEDDEDESESNDDEEFEEEDEQESI